MKEKNKKIIKVIVDIVLSALYYVLIYILIITSLFSLSLVSRGFYDLYGDEIKDMIYDEIGDDFLDHKESNKRMNGKVTNKVGRNMLLDVDDFTNNNIGTRTNYGLYTTSIGSAGGSSWSYIYAVTTLSQGYYNYSFTATADNTNLRTGIRIYQDGSSSMWVNTVETISSTKTYKGTIQITSSSLNVRFDLLRNYYATGYSGNVIWSIMLTESDYDSGLSQGFSDGYDTGYDEGELVGKNNVINNPNNYGLYTEQQYNNNYTAGSQQGYQDGYTNGYDEGELVGKNNVINNPNNYNLYTQTQYNNNYNNGVSNGQNNVISNPNNYDLYTEQQYNNNYNSGYDNGWDSGYDDGKDDVINNPNNYDLYTEQQYNNNYTAGYELGYENGINSSDSYDLGYNNGYDDGYDNGFSSGVNAGINPYYMFEDSYLTLGYLLSDGNDYYEIDYQPYSIGSNHYYDLTSDYSVLYQEWEVDSNHDENGLTFAYINDYGSFVPSNYEIIITGFNRIEFVYGSDDYYSYNISDPYNYTTINLVDLNINESITAINLYSYFTETYFSYNGYKLGFNYINNYDNGYKSGYNQGFSNGKNDVLNNPNNYDLYDNEELNEAKDLSYTQGYNKGVLEGEGLGERGFLTMFNAILNAPYNILNGLLNFELFGVNLFNLVTFILTTGLIIFLFALFKSRK